MFSQIFGPLWSARAWRGWPVLAVALLEIVIFGRCCENWWKYARNPALPTTLVGEGMIIGGDGLSYYAWLRSPLIDGDWSFDNEFDEHNVFKNAVPSPNSRTRRGFRKNFHPIGLACVWAPAVVSTHFALSRVPPERLLYPADGYTLPYQLAVGLTTLAVSLLGLLFLYRICRRYASPVQAALAAGCLTLGTSIVFYSSIEVSMAHGIGTAAVAGLIWYWLKTYGSVSPWRWLLVGILVGLATLIRSQLGTFAVLPAIEALLLCGRSLSGRRYESAGRALLLLGLAGAGAFIAFTPQLASWRYLFGEWWAMPHHLEHHWTNPALWQLLFSLDRSLFYWTPIALVALAGTLLYCVKRPAETPGDELGSALPYLREPLVLLAVAFAAQVYFVGSVFGGGVFLGSAFGCRLLTEALVPLAPGLALLLSQTPRVRSRWIAAACCLLVVWNLLLIRQYYFSIIPHENGADPLTLLANVPKSIHMFGL